MEKYLKELDNKIQSIIDNEKFLYERLQELNLTVNDIHKNTTILLSSKVFPPSEPILGPKYSPPTATGSGIPLPTPCSCPHSQGTSSGTPLQATSTPPASCSSGPPVVTNSGPSSPVSYSVPPPTVTPSCSQATSSGPPAASSTVSSTAPTPPPEIATVQSNIQPPPSKNVPPPPPMHHIKPRRSLLGAPPQYQRNQRLSSPLPPTPHFQHSPSMSLRHKQHQSNKVQKANLHKISKDYYKSRVFNNRITAFSFCVPNDYKNHTLKSTPTTNSTSFEKSSGEIVAAIIVEVIDSINTLDKLPDNNPNATTETDTVNSVIDSLDVSVIDLENDEITDDYGDPVSDPLTNNSLEHSDNNTAQSSLN